MGSLLVISRSGHDFIKYHCRSIEYVALLVDVWLFMVLPTVYALTKSVLPISQGARLHPTHYQKASSLDSCASWACSFLL